MRIFGKEYEGELVLGVVLLVLFAGVGIWYNVIRTSPDKQTSSQCADGSYPVIKGNINKDGVKIYHTPDDRFYDATDINTSAGERWFCTTQDAKDAGWRAPLNQ